MNKITMKQIDTGGDANSLLRGDGALIPANNIITKIARVTGSGINVVIGGQTFQSFSVKTDDNIFSINDIFYLDAGPYVSFMQTIWTSLGAESLFFIVNDSYIIWFDLAYDDIKQLMLVYLKDTWQDDGNTIYDWYTYVEKIDGSRITGTVANASSAVNAIDAQNTSKVSVGRIHDVTTNIIRDKRYLLTYYSSPVTDINTGDKVNLYASKACLFNPYRRMLFGFKGIYETPDVLNDDDLTHIPGIYTNHGTIYGLNDIEKIINISDASYTKNLHTLLYWVDSMLYLLTANFDFYISSGAVRNVVHFKENTKSSNQFISNNYDKIALTFTSYIFTGSYTLNIDLTESFSDYSNDVLIEDSNNVCTLANNKLTVPANTLVQFNHNNNFWYIVVKSHIYLHHSDLQNDINTL